ncbi:major facilitator superfamily domain-containing protein [Stachybotrys elegans]|uniref:Major facilitator superfamily domain-containing protein n=1 Tax=Stachybotrys elegans TaxID=80388 RepID=A0A8K0STX8_9HYPO|nr:major facilitator superfamily domain-containing protein [Stachybotrys elegans]
MGVTVQTNPPQGETPQIIRRINAAYDWDGPDDPDDPRNFPALQRIFSISVIAALAFVSCFAGAIYAPAQELVMDEFRESPLVAVLPLSLYNLGLAFGPLVGAPLSERYGRKIVFVATTPVFVLFMLGAGFARTMAGLVACRFFAGIFASPNINNASATILDYTRGQYRGLSLGIYYSMPSLGATVGPLVGGFVVRSQGWRWTQWVAIIVTVAAYVPVLFTPETYKRVVLRRRALKMGLSDTSSHRMTLGRAIRHFFTVLILRPFHMLCTEPIVTFVSLYNGFIIGLLYAFVVSVPWIFQHYYGFNQTSESLSYLGITLGTLVACVPFVLIDIFYYQRRLQTWQSARGSEEQMSPEHRLISAMVGSILLPTSLIIAGWTAHFHIHWMVPIFFQGMTMVASLLIYAGANLFMLDAYGPLYGASAASAMMFSRYFLSFAFPLFSLRVFQALGVGWATTILAGCTVLMAPIPWLFFAYGPRIRARSKYETSS